MGDFYWEIKKGPYSRCGPDMAIRLTIDVYATQKHYSITNKHQAGPTFVFMLMNINMIIIMVIQLTSHCLNLRT